MDFTESVREWVAVDNRIKKYQGEVKKDRVLRSALTTSILDHAEESNMKNAVIEITDGKLKFQNTRSTAPLTYKFIKECLASCLEENAADQIMQFIKEKREIRYSQEVKRYYN